MISTLRRLVPYQYHNSIERSTLNISPIRISGHERKASRITPKHIQQGLTDFHRNGIVILEDAVDHASLENLHTRMLQDFHSYKKSSAIRWNQGRNTGNISQPLPPLPEFLHESIWANRLGVSLMEHIIGPKPTLSLATSNIALPGVDGRQAVHSDYYCDHHRFPVFLEVNIYLHDVAAHNGATEFWLGTHNGYCKKDHSSCKTGWIRKEIFTQRAVSSPPIQPCIRKGSLLIRDLRLWHAGRANHSSEPRIVLGFMFSPRWFGSHMRMKFPYAARSELEVWDHIECLSSTQFVDDDFDYLENNQDINLTQFGSEIYQKTVHQHGADQIVTPNDYWEPG